MKADFIPEPDLEFGTNTHVDVRFGISTFGPLDVGTATAPKEIRVGLVGTAETIEGVRGWLAKCSAGVTAKKSRLVNLFPAFPGFTEDSPFHSTLIFDDRWTGTLTAREETSLLSVKPTEMISEAVNLFLEYAAQIAERGNLDVIICAPSHELLAQFDEYQGRAVDETEAPLDEGSEPERNVTRQAAFHDVLKASGMRLRVPLQMVRPSTYGLFAKSQGKPSHLQDEATRAWNFHTALYYKAGGIPWRLKRVSSQLATCFVGISFYRTRDGERLLTSVAQVFNERGEGIIVRGAPAQIDKDDRIPHLSSFDAGALLSNAIATYRKEHKTSPARVVVHKTSALTADELDGFVGATRLHNIEVVDLVSVRRSFTRLFREGTYVPLRGTLFHLAREIGVIYLRGSVNFFESYPGLYVPRPLELALSKSDATVLQIATEMMGLSKLNWNNTQFDGGEPITVRAARRVGDILKCLPTDDDGTIQSSFRFYM
jgi:hypothetical protein